MNEVYHCKYCNLEFTNRQKLAGHTTHCKESPNYERNLKRCNNLNVTATSSRIKRLFTCQYCNRTRLTNQSGNTCHEQRCKKNPNRVILVSHHKGSSGVGCHKSWNKGLTVETDPRVAKYVSTKKQHLKEGKFHSWVKGKTKYTDERIAKSAKKISEMCLRKSQEGAWHKSLAKHMHYIYKGIDLDGSWELEYAKYLDSNNIKWLRPKYRFEYMFEDKIRHYTPDFYLVDQKLYIEIKGYKTKKDEAKWTQFPKDKKLRVLLQKDLLDLGLKIKL